MNDVTSAVRYTSCNIYADNTVIYVAAPDHNLAATKLQCDIDNIALWFNNNKLAINVNKTAHWRVPFVLSPVR